MLQNLGDESQKFTETQDAESAATVQRLLRFFRIFTPDIQSIPPMDISESCLGQSSPAGLIKIRCNLPYTQASYAFDPLFWAPDFGR